MAGRLLPHYRVLLVEPVLIELASLCVVEGRGQIFIGKMGCETPRVLQGRLVIRGERGSRAKDKLVLRGARLLASFGQLLPPRVVPERRRVLWRGERLLICRRGFCTAVAAGVVRAPPRPVHLQGAR